MIPTQSLDDSSFPNYQNWIYFGIKKHDQNFSNPTWNQTQSLLSSEKKLALIFPMLLSSIPQSSSSKEQGKTGAKENES